MKDTVTNTKQDEHANVVELTDGELTTVSGGFQSAYDPYHHRYNDRRYYDHRRRYDYHRRYYDHRRYGHP